MAMANFTGNPQARQMGRKQFYNPDMDPQQNLQLATMLGEHLDRVQRQDQQGNRDPGLDSLVMAMANAGAVNQQNIAQKQVAQADMTVRTGEANANRSLQGQLAQLQADTQGKVLASEDKHKTDALEQQGKEFESTQGLKSKEFNLNRFRDATDAAGKQVQLLRDKGLPLDDPIMDQAMTKYNVLLSKQLEGLSGDSPFGKPVQASASPKEVLPAAVGNPQPTVSQRPATAEERDLIKGKAQQAVRENKTELGKYYMAQANTAYPDRVVISPQAAQEKADLEGSLASQQRNKEGRPSRLPENQIDYPKSQAMMHDMAGKVMGSHTNDVIQTTTDSDYANEIAGQPAFQTWLTNEVKRRVLNGESVQQITGKSGVGDMAWASAYEKAVPSWAGYIKKSVAKAVKDKVDGLAADLLNDPSATSDIRKAQTTKQNLPQISAYNQ